MSDFFDNVTLELYDEADHSAVENHISQYFGQNTLVLHEMLSDYIHVDVILIEPKPERNFFTLITLGMGAHKMDVPEGLRGSKDRAELMINLPPSWKLNEKNEIWYWPIGLLKSLARLPIYASTWLGYGHTVASSDPPSPYADNALFCAALLSLPYFFGEDSYVCAISKNELVNFYQIIPIYESEMNFKLQNSAKELESLILGDINNNPCIIDINRINAIIN
ncbi:MAG: suppressor of fused domain protein [Deltaproteobacteria bacterium]|jgi:hypothetical protein|nr:suppressor of fused domain protein [Deltaproteobacteria bacterium]